MASLLKRFRKQVENVAQVSKIARQWLEKSSGEGADTSRFSPFDCGGWVRRTALEAAFSLDWMSFASDAARAASAAVEEDDRCTLW